MLSLNKKKISQKKQQNLQCEEKCPSTQAMLVGKLCKSRKVTEKGEKKVGSKKWLVRKIK